MLSAPVPTSGAVFLSYAREDAAAARRIADALRAFGVEVWFDQHELRGGDAWDAKIKKQIRECALFVAIVSATTEARPEGYFRREWKLAVERTHDMAASRAFLVPVVIDATPEGGAEVPEEFMRVQWTRLENGVPTPEFVAQVRRLLETPRKPLEAGRPRSAQRDEGVASPTGSPTAVKAEPSAARRAPLVLSAVVGAAAAVGLFVWFGASKSSNPGASVANNSPATATAPAANGSAAIPSPAALKADEKSVAVLPFANLSGDPAQEYFSDGITEEILNALARERDLRVVPRTTAFAFKEQKGKSISDIAIALNVAQIVEGSVRKSGQRVRISVQLTRVADGFVDPLPTVEREVTDIFALQDEVARAVVQKLTRRASSGAGIAVLTKNVEAYDLYLRGRALQTRAAQRAKDAAQLYEQAVALDPSFALAWARLGETSLREYIGQIDHSAATVERARRAIDRALALSPDLAEGLVARANWFRQVESNYVEAQRDLQRAESLQPPTAELRYVQALLARDSGDWVSAFRLIDQALQLDPHNGDLTNTAAVNFYTVQGRYAEADRLYARAILIQGPTIPTPFTNRVQGRTYWRGPAAALRFVEKAPAEQAGLAAAHAYVLAQLGRFDEALRYVDQNELPAPGSDPAAAFAAMRRTGSSRAARLLLYPDLGSPEERRQRAEAVRRVMAAERERGNRSPLVHADLVRAEIVLGHRDAALTLLEEWRQAAFRSPSRYRRVTDFNRRAVGLYAMLGKSEEELALLRELFASGVHLGFALASDPDMASMRSHPEFQKLVGAEEAWARAQPDPVD